MKKIVLIALFLTAFGIVGVSQTGVYSGVLGKPIKPLKNDFRKTGLIIRPELGTIYDAYSSFFKYYFISGNVGYQLTPYLYVGGGLGYLDYDNSFKNSYASYLSVRCCWFDKSISPFFELQTGLAYGGYDGVYALFLPAIGYSIKNCDFKFVFFYTGLNWYTDIPLTISISYSFTVNKMKKTIYSEDVSRHNLKSSLY